MSCMVTGCSADCPTPTAPFRTDFPDTRLGEAAFQFVDVENVCREQIEIGPVELTGDPAFLLDEAPPSLPPESVAGFVFTFTADGYGPRIAEVEVPTLWGSVVWILTGHADPDQDGDGVAAVLAGGTDCDDQNPERGCGSRAARPETGERRHVSIAGLVA
jgi:hypothetical protein